VERDALVLMKGLPGGAAKRRLFTVKSAVIPPHNYKLNAGEGIHYYIWSFVTWITLIAEDKAS
jgi:hypothetical protein